MKQVQINGEKLRRIFTERKVNMAQAGRDIGYASTYLSKCCGVGSISKAAAQLLAVRHGIMLEDYIYTEPPKPEPEQLTIPADEAEIKTAPTATLDITALQEAVAMALTNMKTDYDALRGAIREGILDAIYAAINDADTRNAISGLLTSAHLSALQLNLKKVKDGMKK